MYSVCSDEEMGEGTYGEGLDMPSKQVSAVAHKYLQSLERSQLQSQSVDCALVAEILVLGTEAHESCLGNCDLLATDFRETNSALGSFQSSLAGTNAVGRVLVPVDPRNSVVSGTDLGLTWVQACHS